MKHDYRKTTALFRRSVSHNTARLFQDSKTSFRKVVLIGSVINYNSPAKSTGQKLYLTKNQIQILSEDLTEKKKNIRPCMRNINKETKEKHSDAKEKKDKHKEGTAPHIPQISPFIYDKSYQGEIGKRKTIHLLQKRQSTQTITYASESKQVIKISECTECQDLELCTHFKGTESIDQLLSDDTCLKIGKKESLKNIKTRISVLKCDCYNHLEHDKFSVDEDEKYPGQKNLKCIAEKDLASISEEFGNIELVRQVIGTKNQKRLGALFIRQKNKETLKGFVGVVVKRNQFFVKEQKVKEFDEFQRERIKEEEKIPESQVRSSKTVYHQDGSRTVYDPDGTKTVYGIDGTKTVYNPNGTKTVYDIDGTKTVYNIDGTRTVYDLDGTKTVYDIDGTKTVYDIDGTKTVYDLNGTKTVYDLDGTRTEYHQDGTRTVYEQNGTITEYNQEGRKIDIGLESIKIVYGEDGTKTVFERDGTKIVYHPDGTRTVYNIDGTKTVYGTDGIRTVYHPNGVKTVYDIDGTRTVYDPDGTRTVYEEDGTKTVYGIDGIKTEYFTDGTKIIYGHDGTRTVCKPDGTKTVYDHNGTRTVYDREGRRIVYDIDGTRTVYDLDGTKTVYHIDGTRTVYRKNGTKIRYYQKPKKEANKTFAIAKSRVPEPKKRVKPDDLLTRFATIKVHKPLKYSTKFDLGNKGRGFRLSDWGIYKDFTTSKKEVKTKGKSRKMARSEPDTSQAGAKGDSAKREKWGAISEDGVSDDFRKSKKIPGIQTLSESDETLVSQLQEKLITTKSKTEITFNRLKKKQFRDPEYVRDSVHQKRVIAAREKKAEKRLEEMRIASENQISKLAQLDKKNLDIPEEDYYESAESAETAPAESETESLDLLPDELDVLTQTQNQQPLIPSKEYERASSNRQMFVKLDSYVMNTERFQKSLLKLKVLEIFETCKDKSYQGEGRPQDLTEIIFQQFEDGKINENEFQAMRTTLDECFESKPTAEVIVSPKLPKAELSARPEKPTAELAVQKPVLKKTATGKLSKKSHAQKSRAKGIEKRKIPAVTSEMRRRKFNFFIENMKLLSELRIVNQLTEPYIFSYYVNWPPLIVEPKKKGKKGIK